MEINEIRNDLISRRQLQGIESLLWCDTYEGSKEARNLYEQMMYDIEHIEPAVAMPEDFKMKIYNKSVIKDLEIMVIYFDEDIWDVDSLCAWAEYIQKFFDKPLMMLPKSFSGLESLTYEQALALRDKCNKVIEDARH